MNYSKTATTQKRASGYLPAQVGQVSGTSHLPQAATGDKIVAQPKVGVATSYSNLKEPSKNDELRQNQRLTDGALVSLADMPSVTSPTSCAHGPFHAPPAEDFTALMSHKVSFEKEKFSEDQQLLAEAKNVGGKRKLHCRNNQIQNQAPLRRGIKKSKKITKKAKVMLKTKQICTGPGSPRPLPEEVNSASPLPPPAQAMPAQFMIDLPAGLTECFNQSPLQVQSIPTSQSDTAEKVHSFCALFDPNQRMTPSLSSVTDLQALSLHHLDFIYLRQQFREMHALVKKDLVTLVANRLFSATRTTIDQIQNHQQLLSVLEERIKAIDTFCHRLKQVSQEHLEKEQAAVVASLASLFSTLSSHRKRSLDLPATPLSTCQNQGLIATKQQVNQQLPQQQEPPTLKLFQSSSTTEVQKTDSTDPYSVHLSPRDATE